MKKQKDTDIPVGTRALIFSKLYYGVLSKSLEDLDIERYYSILYFLNANNGCNQQWICNNLAIDKTAMVKVINYLMKCGYILRKINPLDRREHFITLTPKGQKHTQEIVKSFNSIDEKIFSTVSKSERTTFVKVLNQLSDNLKRMPGDNIFFNYKKSVLSGTKQTRRPRRTNKPLKTA